MGRTVPGQYIWFFLSLSFCSFQRIKTLLHMSHIFHFSCLIQIKQKPKNLISHLTTTQFRLQLIPKNLFLHIFCLLTLKRQYLPKNSLCFKRNQNLPKYLFHKSLQVVQPIDYVYCDRWRLINILFYFLIEPFLYFWIQSQTVQVPQEDRWCLV